MQTHLFPHSRITKRSVGALDPADWIAEGDGLLASARKSREVWLDHREIFSQTVQDRKSGTRDACSDWNLLTGLPRASMLLLAYSIEMYLKAGLVKAYQGCRTQMFERDVKRKFGHKLNLLANEIAFRLETDDEANFNLLEEIILADARYPVFVPEGKSYISVTNEQTQRIWSVDHFSASIELASRIRGHSSAIDKDSNDPLFHSSYTIDENGYLSFRIGGRLPPRITYRVSTDQKQSGKESLDDMKKLFAQSEFALLNGLWPQAWIYEDSDKTTTCLYLPLRTTAFTPS